jgi:hypothetical protein
MIITAVASKLWFCVSQAFVANVWVEQHFVTSGLPLFDEFGIAEQFDIWYLRLIKTSLLYARCSI